MNDEVSRNPEEPTFEGEVPEKHLPRWVQIPVGVVLICFTLLALLGSGSMLVSRSEKAPIFTTIVGVVLLLGCFWVLEKCLRLLTGRKNRGGLMAPNTLRVVSYCILALPLAGFFTGYYRRFGLLAIHQAIMYFSAFFGLQALARKREITEMEQAKTGEPETRDPL
jgi:hypothetical protein